MVKYRRVTSGRAESRLLHCRVSFTFWLFNVRSSVFGLLPSLYRMLQSIQLRTFHSAIGVPGNTMDFSRFLIIAKVSSPELRGS